MTGFSVVVPARYGSTRLPGKPLVDLGGKTMIARVAEQVAKSDAVEIIVATDDQRVVDALAARTDVTVCMTRADHATGSDRVLEVVDRNGWADEHVVVNVQGDEPLVPPEVVNQVAALLDQHDEFGVATLSEPLRDAASVFDPNIVKVVCNTGGRALYFSRAPIPFARGRFEQTPPRALGHGWCRHIGIYAYRVGALRRFVTLPASRLEQTEALEQLRLLENGIDIVVADSCAPVPGGVDTAADVERVRRIIAAAS
ncbi:MAG: 3-deoxy-manno-octulosonate cytidylyltransferase [Gammaproteobacteria bacterium]|nr:3-deoxy-manno-octulosonate cytidylyltransferase [Gammaproteobacteria bacterium]